MCRRFRDILIGVRRLNVGWFLVLLQVASSGVTGKEYCGTKTGAAGLLICGVGARLCLCRNGRAMRLLCIAAGCEGLGRKRNRGVTGGITLEDRVALSGRAHSIKCLLRISGSQLHASSA